MNAEQRAKLRQEFAQNQDIRAVRTPTKLDQLKARIHPPVNVLPPHHLPRWKDYPLEQKFPVIPSNKGTFSYGRNALGESIFVPQHCKFDLDDPLIQNTPISYTDLHDLALKDYFLSNPKLFERLVEVGLVEEDGTVKATMEEYNTYRRYLARLRDCVVKKDLTCKDNRYTEGHEQLKRILHDETKKLSKARDEYNARRLKALKDERDQKELYLKLNRPVVSDRYLKDRERLRTARMIEREEVRQRVRKRLAKIKKAEKQRARKIILDWYCRQLYADMLKKAIHEHKMEEKRQDLDSFVKAKRQFQKKKLKYLKNLKEKSDAELECSISHREKMYSKMEEQRLEKMKEKALKDEAIARREAYLMRKFGMKWLRIVKQQREYHQNYHDSVWRVRAQLKEMVTELKDESGQVSFTNFIKGLINMKPGRQPMPEMTPQTREIMNYILDLLIQSAINTYRSSHRPCSKAYYKLQNRRRILGKKDLTEEDFKSPRYKMRDKPYVPWVKPKHPCRREGCEEGEMCLDEEEYFDEERMMWGEDEEMHDEAGRLADEEIQSYLSGLKKEKPPGAGKNKGGSGKRRKSKVETEDEDEGDNYVEEKADAKPSKKDQRSASGKPSKSRQSKDSTKPEKDYRDVPIREEAAYGGASEERDGGPGPTKDEAVGQKKDEATGQKKADDAGQKQGVDAGQKKDGEPGQKVDEGRDAGQQADEQPGKADKGDGGKPEPGTPSESSKSEISKAEAGRTETKVSPTYSTVDTTRGEDSSSRSAVDTSREAATPSRSEADTTRGVGSPSLSAADIPGGLGTPSLSAADIPGGLGTPSQSVVGKTGEPSASTLGGGSQTTFATEGSDDYDDLVARSIQAASKGLVCTPTDENVDTSRSALGTTGGPSASTLKGDSQTTLATEGSDDYDDLVARSIQAASKGLVCTPTDESIRPESTTDYATRTASRETTRSDLSGVDSGVSKPTDHPSAATRSSGNSDEANRLVTESISKAAAGLDCNEGDGSTKPSSVDISKGDLQQGQPSSLHSRPSSGTVDSSRGNLGQGQPSSMHSRASLGTAESSRGDLGEGQPSSMYSGLSSGRSSSLDSDDAANVVANSLNKVAKGLSCDDNFSFSDRGQSGTTYSAPKSGRSSTDSENAQDLVGKALGTAVNDIACGGQSVDETQSQNGSYASSRSKLTSRSDDSVDATDLITRVIKKAAVDLACDDIESEFSLETPRTPGRELDESSNESDEAVSVVGKTMTNAFRDLACDDQGSNYASSEAGSLELYGREKAAKDDVQTTIDKANERIGGGPESGRSEESNGSEVVERILKCAKRELACKGGSSTSRSDGSDLVEKLLQCARQELGCEGGETSRSDGSDLIEKLLQCARRELACDGGETSRSDGSELVEKLLDCARKEFCCDGGETSRSEGSELAEKILQCAKRELACDGGETSRSDGSELVEKLVKCAKKELGCDRGETSRSEGSDLFDKTLERAQTELSCTSEDNRGQPGESSRSGPSRGREDFMAREAQRWDNADVTESVTRGAASSRVPGQGTPAGYFDCERDGSGYQQNYDDNLIEVMAKNLAEEPISCEDIPGGGEMPQVLDPTAMYNDIDSEAESLARAGRELSSDTREHVIRTLSNIQHQLAAIKEELRKYGVIPPSERQ